jgi:hypothetical protein
VNIIVTSKLAYYRLRGGYYAHLNNYKCYINDGIYVIQWYAKTKEESLRTYPNSAVVNFTKRCYVMVC